MKYLFFALIILSVSACDWGPHDKTHTPKRDTLAYNYQLFNHKAPGYANKGVLSKDSVVIFISKYPVFKTQPVLNDTIVKRLSSLFRKRDTSIQQLSSDFEADYTAYMKTTQAASYVVGYVMRSAATIVSQDSGIVVLTFNGHEYIGGQHGNNISNFLNWDIKAAKKITLDDILVKGYETQLNAIAETIFRKQEKLDNTASLEKDYYFKDGKFALNKNFELTPNGISFLFNETEIKPYSAGQTEVDIPYSKIKLLLLPRTVISQYIK